MGRKAFEIRYGVTEAELTEETQRLANLPEGVTW